VVAQSALPGNGPNLVVTFGSTWAEDGTITGSWMQAVAWDEDTGPTLEPNFSGC
jgi:hypothetical protein